MNQQQVSPKFTNTSMILADAVCDRPSLQRVRVLNKTANVTNGKVLIRRFVDAPDGYYDIDIMGCLVNPRPTLPFGSEYPDIEAWRPSFEEMRPFCDLDNNEIQKMVELCNICCQHNNNGYYVNLHKIVIAPNGMYIAKAEYNGHKNYIVTNETKSMEHGFNLPSPLVLDSLYLKTILVEMLQYPVIQLLMDTRYTNMPLIFGKDWGSCGIIAPVTDCRVERRG